ncbi:hypothetical protein CHLRE_12g497650v5 [Chlamydomonas reinhardtii]|uniref:Thymocyte nuclear protein 1 n=1 Tax=Chlamydomonas reinhardtii TaxID=3055 RepID=A8JGL4_CHLRE|nr:uncharacterized protein CHLRE_12g497650v5 [Chlamydomonas reinhardtii]PNW75076.1 hypothetical protein CHLRE_12g497650v5 [Chlamydomonas reinhardtii]|eukprot:XP_001702358.1 predicted protein [Chlamydomonas reinhardtii]
MAPRKKNVKEDEAEAEPAEAAVEPRAKRTRRGADADAAAANDNKPGHADVKGKGKGKAASKAAPKAAAAADADEEPAAATAAAAKAPGKGKSKAAAADGGATRSAAAGPKAEAAAAGAGGDGSSGGGKKYYLMKSEPEEFSLDDLEAKPESIGHWEGVRNAQARNIMRGMRLGDEALFYHSSCKVPAAVGVVRVVREAYPDHFAFDKKSKYYDERSTPDNPKWWMVDVQLVRRLARPVTLAELRAEGAKAGSPVASMVLINKSRLSVQPVTEEQWNVVMQLEKQDKADA